MVSWRDTWLAVYTGNEYEYGCTAAGTYSLTMQGRVYAARNSLQFFTIPVGYFLGGALIDYILEPFMAGQAEASLLISILGSGKGSGAALLFLILGLAGIAVCLLFRRDKNIWSLEEHK